MLSNKSVILGSTNLSISSNIYTDLQNKYACTQAKAPTIFLLGEEFLTYPIKAVVILRQAKL